MAGTITVGELLSDATSSNKITIGSGTTLDLKASAGSTTMPAGSVLQVVDGTSTNAYSTSSTTWSATNNLSKVITTTEANSKILVTMVAPWQLNSGSTIRAVIAVRSSLDSYATSLFEQVFVIESNWYQLGNCIQFVHEPAQVAGTAITYKGYVKRAAGSGTLYIHDTWGAATSGVPSSVVILTEIGA